MYLIIPRKYIYLESGVSLSGTLSVVERFQEKNYQERFMECKISIMFSQVSCIVISFFV